MKYLKKTISLFVLLSCWLCLSLSAEAGNAAEQSRLHLGLGAGVITSEYRQTDGRVVPIPIISYEGERFYIRGITGGMYLYKGLNNEIAVNLSYLPQFFDPKKSDSRSMKRLDKRYSTMLAGLTYRHAGNWGVARLYAGVDTLGHSDGIVLEGSYSYPFKIDKINIAPTLGVSWTSDKHNDYYYGISGSESAKSGYKRYKPGSEFSPYFGLHISTHLFSKLSVFATGRLTYMNDEITDSPMVGKDFKMLLGTGLMLSF